jgi:hypothetical protein
MMIWSVHGHSVQWSLLGRSAVSTRGLVSDTSDAISFSTIRSWCWYQLKSQSLKRRTPTLHWRNWRPDKTSLTMYCFDSVTVAYFSFKEAYKTMILLYGSVPFCLFVWSGWIGSGKLLLVLASKSFLGSSSSGHMTSLYCLTTLRVVELLSSCSFISIF